MRRAAALTGLLVVLALPGPARADQREQVAGVGIDQRLGEQVPLDLHFRDEEGRAVTLGDYFGSKPVILVLAYYRCPRLCSLVLNKLVESLRELKYEVGNEFEVVVVSIDPKEGPELAKAKQAAYVDAYGRPGAGGGWHFLTGEEAAIRRLAAAVGFRYFWDDKMGQYAHASGIMMLTPRGKLARYFYGLDYPARDLQFGLEDAAARRIGHPVVEPLRMLCFDYDPVTGAYSLQILRLMRFAGAGTVLGLAGFFWWQWRRGRGRFLRRRRCIAEPGVAQRSPGTGDTPGATYPEGVPSGASAGPDATPSA